ncbi:GntR family transcriptional regulator [Streptomyces albulus]|nr:GntR family transcriptional regulator [Streptomyces noursei]
MLVTIDHGSSVPLAEQIAASVRRALAEGKLRKGERLPAARTLAGTLDVNMHTVLRGYQILQQEDLIDLRRGRGAVVSGRSPGDRALVVETCRQLVGLAQGIGLEERDVLTMVSDTYRSLV